MGAAKRIKILVAPLDWGLGHATRCIPIINELLENGCEVIIAATGKQKLLLQQEFPLLRFFDLPGYKVGYSKKSYLNLLKITLQVPGILIQIGREKKWLANYIRHEHLDAVISDNRYGLYAQGLCTAFVTHQLYIKTPFGKNLSAILSAILYQYINRFSLCWIPDFENRFSMAGELAHPAKLPAIPTRYIGALTRFSTLTPEPEHDGLLIIISGPEPQRTIFENKLLGQLKNYTGNVTLVRGLPGHNETPAISSNTRIYNHLPSVELNTAMCKSAFVIARSGYSTVMDVLSLGKKSILIPTPGQPEQAYLAKYLFNKKMIYSVNQDAFDLEKCLEGARAFHYVKQDPNDITLLPRAVEELIRMIAT